MSSDRVTGATLNASALVLLVAGATWYFGTAPQLGEDPAVTEGRATVERLLPDLPRQARAETMVLTAGLNIERTTDVSGGSYALTLLCVGDGQVRVRLSAVGEDTGRAVPCGAGDPEPVELMVGVADDLYFSVTAETEGQAVFRWRVARSRSY